MENLKSCCRKNCDKRILTKTLIWRIIASATTFLAAYILSGEIKQAGGIMLIDTSAKTLIYYLHEIAWNTCWPVNVNNNQKELEMTQTEDTSNKENETVNETENIDI